MRPISRWVHLMSSTVQLAARSTTPFDGYGAAQFGADVNYRAHLRGAVQLVRNAAGQEVVSRRMVYVATTIDIQPSARLTLSTGDCGSTENSQRMPVILSVEKRFDKHGPHHTVLYLE